MQREMLVSMVVVSVMKLTCASSDAGNGRGCYYKGRYHKQSWEDGCQYVCTCENIETGYLRCKRRCPTYKRIPDGCTLQLPPNEPCCKVPVCPEQTTVPYTFTTTQSNNIIYTTTSLKSVNYTGQNKPDGLPKRLKSNSSMDTLLSEHLPKQMNMSEPRATTREVQTMVKTNDNFKQDIVAIDEQNTVSIMDASHSLLENNDHFNTDASLISDNGRHALGYQKSVDEIVPFDIASTEEIFLNFPVMEEIAVFDNHENIPLFENSSDGSVISSSVRSNIKQLYDTPETIITEPTDLIFYDNISLEVTEQQINTNYSTQIQFAPSNDSNVNNQHATETSETGVYNNIFSNSITTSGTPSSNNEYMPHQNETVSSNINKTIAVTRRLNNTRNIVSNTNNITAVISTINNTGTVLSKISNTPTITNSLNNTKAEVSNINKTAAVTSTFNNTGTVLSNINSTAAVTSSLNTRVVVSNLSNTNAITISVNNTRAVVSNINNTAAVTSGVNNTITVKSNKNNTSAVTSNGIHGQSKDKYYPKEGKDDGSSNPKIKGMTSSNQYPRTNMHRIGTISSRRCVFMGMRFNTRQTWFDGCRQICMCLNARIGFFKCIERCPVFNTLPKGCLLKASTGCCPLPVCNNTTRPERKSHTNPRARYRPMSIADRFNLRLVNSKTTSVVDQLTLYTKLPPTELLSDTFKHSTSKTDDSDKMSRTNSVRSTRLGPIHTATGIYRLNRVIGSTNRREGNLVPVIPRGEGITEERASLSATNDSATQGRLREAENNTRSWQTMIGFCVYNGGLYKPGDRWEIGCELVCECLQGIQGNYDCKRRCPMLPVIPLGCSVQRSPEDPCCKTPVCPNAVRRNITQDGHNIPKHSPTMLQKLIARKFIHSNPKTTESVRNRVPLPLVNQPASNKLSSTGIMAAKRGLSKSPRHVNQTVVTTKFNDNRNTGQANLPSNRVSIRQTGAVLISKPNKNPKTSPIHIAMRGCSVGNKVYRKGQSWKIGCRLRCFCTDEIKQTMSCTHLCPRWKLPSVCILEQPSKGRCCPVPKCPDGYVMKYPDGYVPL